MTAPIEFLQASSYFEGLTPAELASISGLFFERKVGKGESIFWEGDPGEVLYFVVSGAVKYFKTSEEGKEQILLIVLPGMSFNEVAIFDDGPNPASAEAMSLVVLYGISKQDVGKVLADYPAVASNVVKILTERMNQLLELVEDLSFRHVISRIARILLEYADGAGPKPKLTQQEMAALAGTAREVVGRSLKTMQEEGMIRMERNRLVISNKSALTQLVNTHP